MTAAALHRWFGPPPRAGVNGLEPNDFVLAGWIFVVVWAVKWGGASLFLTPYDLETSPWRFGYEVGHIAGNLAAGKGFSVAAGGERFLPSAWMSPVYPLLLSWVFRACGAFSSLAAHVVVLGNCLFQAGTASLLYLLGQRLGGKRVAAAAVVLFVLNPGGWQFLAWAWPTQLFALAILAHFTVLFFGGAGTRGNGALVGSSLGLALLVDGAAIMFAPVTLLVVTDAARRSGSRGYVGLVLVSFLVVLTPWSLRNQQVLGVMNPLRGNVGVNLWVGNHPGALAESFHGMQLSPWHQRGEGQKMAELGERAYDQLCRERAIAEISDHPVAFVTHSALRFSGFWLAEWWVGFRHIDWWYTLGHVALTGLALLGAWRARGRGIGLVVVGVLLFAIPYTLTVHGHGRYRVPVEPLLCLLAAFSAGGWPRSSGSTTRDRAA